jgi:hypothetical protein
VDEARVRDAVERMSRHIVRALSRRDLDGYRAAYHLPGVGERPERGADIAVLASLPPGWTGLAGLMFDVAGLEQVIRIQGSTTLTRRSPRTATHAAKRHLDPMSKHDRVEPCG